MPIKKRVHRWEVTVQHKGERLRRSFVRYEDAETWEVHAKLALKQGKPVDLGENASQGPNEAAQGPTLWNLMCDTIRHEWKGTRNEKASSNNAELCVRFLGVDRDPRSITAREISEMRLKWEADGISPGTINRRLSALSKMFTYAVDTELMVAKPRIKRPREAQGRIRFLSHAEEEQLLNTLQGCITSLVKIAIDTGMRLSELLALEGRDVGNREIHLWKNKTDTPRTIPLTQRAWDILEFKALQDDGPLFPLWNVHKFEYEWNKARKAMGLADDPHFVPHVMRHTFCSRLAQAGESPFVIMKLAGHRNISTTQRYVHLTTGNLRSAIEGLEATRAAQPQAAEA